MVNTLLLIGFIFLSIMLEIKLGYKSRVKKAESKEKQPFLSELTHLRYENEVN
jgi:hypothetical protein